MRNTRGRNFGVGLRCSLLVGVLCSVLGAVELAQADMGPSCGCRVGADRDAERGLMLGLLGSALGLALWLGRSRGR